MPLSPSHAPALRRFAFASVSMLVPEAALLAMLAAQGVNLYLACALSLATGILLVAALRPARMLGSGVRLRTAKDQPVPLAALGFAGGLLGFVVFVRVAHILPQPLGLYSLWLALGIGGIAGTGLNLFLINSLIAADHGAAVSRPLTGTRRLKTALVWGLFALLTLGTSKLTGHLAEIFRYPDLEFPLNPADPDAWQRLVQLRQWLTGGDFFDHHVYRTNAPFGGITTHWTRPLDFLLALFYRLTPAHFSTDIRLLLAAAWMPVTLAFATLGILGAAAQRPFRHWQALACMAILLLTSIYDYTAPGDADHHGLLATLWCGVLLILLQERIAPLAALLMGAFMGLMLWTSPEALALMGAVFMMLGVDAILRPSRAALLPMAAIGAAAVATFGVFVEMPAGAILSAAHFDTLSIVHVVLLWITAATTNAMAVTFRGLRGPRARFISAALFGLATLLVQYCLYPRFFLGPLADADPFIFDVFLPSIGEARPLFASAPEFAMRGIAVPVFAVFLLGFAFAQKYIRPARYHWLLKISTLLALTGMMTLLQARWGYYLQPVAALAVAALLPAMARAAKGDTGGWLRGAPGIARPFVVLGILALATSMATRFVAPAKGRDAWCTTELRYIVQTGQLQQKLGDRDLILYVPEDIGGEIQFFTPYRIIASNYHREAAGLRDMAAIRAATTPDALREILRKRQVGAMLFCPSSTAAPALRDALPAWATPVTGLRFFDAPGGKPILLKVQP